MKTYRVQYKKFHGIYFLVLLSLICVVFIHRTTYMFKSPSPVVLEQRAVGGFKLDMGIIAANSTVSKKLFSGSKRARVRDLSAIVAAWSKDARRVLDVGSNLWHGNLIKDQAIMYMQLLLDPALNISTVCETGFFRGVSTHLWLYTNSNVQVHSFDIDFNKKSLSHLVQRFPGRLFAYKGNSKDTIPNLPKEIICDLISIDGDHSGWQPYDDVVKLAQHAHSTQRVGAPTYVLFDDTFDLPKSMNFSQTEFRIENNPTSPDWLNFCTRSYWHAVKARLIQHVKCTRFAEYDDNFPKGFCMGKLL